MFSDAVIHTLVMPAQNHDVLSQRQLIGYGLVEQFAVGRGENYLVIFTLALQLLHATEHRLDLHNHSCLSAKGVVVNLAVLVGGPVAQVVDVNFH